MIANLDMTLPNGSCRQFENTPCLPADRSDPEAAKMLPNLKHLHARVESDDINWETHSPSVYPGTRRDEKPLSGVEAASAQQAYQP